MSHTAMIKKGLRQLPLEALLRAKHRCKIEPYKIQLDGGINNAAKGTY